MAVGAFREEDEALLERLEDEAIVLAMFRHHVPDVRAAGPPPLHPRASGLVALARAEPGGAAACDVARGGDVVPLVRLLETPPMSARPPALLHHLSLYHATVARSLEASAVEAAANAWIRSIAAWLALADERRYLETLTSAILGPDAGGSRSAAVSAERVPTLVIADIGARAEAAARDLAPAGRSALLALSWIDDAVRLSGVASALVDSARGEAERRRNAAVEAALAGVAEAFEDAKARGRVAASAREILVAAVDVWSWSAYDEAVEHFCVDRLGTAGWELYRARDWDALRRLLEPFRAMVDHLADRIERDPTKIAYAAACAEMYVFLADVDRVLPQKLAYAERALRVCPSHRNGRVTLAALLAEEAMTIMRGTMSILARRSDLERVDALLDRAEKLHPQATEVEEARAMLARVRRGAISI